MHQGASTDRPHHGRRALPTGDTIVNHMVFHDIAPDSLVWDWEASRDAGRTWELIWSITYRRRK